MIAEQGYDALSTRALAKAAGVTQPTLYNLIGSKDEIVKTLLMEAASRIIDHVLMLKIDDPIEWIEAANGRLIEVIGEDENYYRAAVIAGDRNADLFADTEEGEEVTPFIGARVTALSRAMFQAQIEQKNLRGNISAAALSAALYASFRVNLRDWAYDLISLRTFDRKTRSAHYVILAADAAPELRRRAMEGHAALDAAEVDGT